MDAEREGHTMPNPDLHEQARGLLSHFDPDPDALLMWLAPQIDDALLEEIAAADYGMDLDEHLAALRRIRDDGVVLAPMRWEPREVLELIRWSEPEDPQWKPGRMGPDGHRMRAFACAALLRAAAEPANWPYFDGENQTLIQLIASVRQFEPVAAVVALRSIAWRALLLPPDEVERPFFALAVLLLAALRHEVDGQLLCDLCDWVIAEEAAVRLDPEHAFPAASDPWMFGLTFFNARDYVWRSVAWQILVERSALLPLAARERLWDIAVRLDARA